MSDTTTSSQSPLLHARNIVLLSLWLTHLFFADLALSALLPLSLLFPTICYDAASYIAYTVWLAVQRICTTANGAHITVTGDVLPKGESAIVICNHVEWTDFYLIQELALRAGMLSRCRWFAKTQLRWVPFLGWGLWAMGMPLVSRNWTHDQREMERVFSGVKERDWPIWLISYPESTRYTPSKHLEAEQWASSHSRPTPPSNLLLPRYKGFVACVQQLRTTRHVTAVYDLTIAYARKGEWQKPPAFWETLLNPAIGRECDLLVHARRFELKGLPENHEGIREWLEQRWVEKGELLEKYKEKLAEEKSQRAAGLQVKQNGKAA